MKFTVLFFACAVNCHTLFTNLFINGKDQGDGTCVRMPRDPSTANGPTVPITGDVMACGRDGNKPVAFTCPTPHRATLTFEFREHSEKRGGGSIDVRHKGPCAVYLKKVENMTADNAAPGPGWFKIWEDGYNNKTMKWCVDTLVENNGLLSVRLPPGLPSGNYLVRPEILALQNAVKGDPQFYTGCAQLSVEQGPDVALKIPSVNSVSIPGYVSLNDAGLKYDLYQKPLAEYKMPGPAVFIPTGQVSGKASVKGEGAVPGDCIVKNANWCAKPVPSFSDESGCWASDKDCWSQMKICFDTAPPSGSAGCKTWETYCKQLQKSCESKAFNGPPQIAEKEKTVDLPGKIPQPWNDVFDLAPAHRRRVRRQLH
ncbi:hypothetical protein QQS21_011214 [Conoideocrella luteorostrata]|uniref:lytic cellulose monooxygenase (C4-dehydrogenating) n=1 Tax=Conoideocrella luteorostrata TaxID=1105319 RepID=A0AAJ0FTY3_9HYPO|nr:hypothetical protein QQS21_011214 [Conoideocrella luteorostrata]